jgi:hypothetical protein
MMNNRYCNLLIIKYLRKSKPTFQQFPLWVFKAAENADFADLTQILLNIDFKSALNQR